ncbi:hypothetical protein [Nonomuraea jabiensis]|uniref:hypothetical protein n=1 Tax=Nonomuraea jabiensis TaxID=882448 RepID=UPI0036B6035F
MYDIFEDIAALLHRLPLASTCADDVSIHQLAADLKRKREAEVRALTEVHQAATDGSDPLLDKLRELSALKREIDEQLSHLIVYSRHFVRPRPYQLSLVADATGLSISGVRAISGRKCEMEEVARNLERSDTKGMLTPGVKLEKSLANLEALASKQGWRTVVYRLAGTASSADATMKTATGIKKTAGVKLPADFSYSIPPGAPVHVSLQSKAAAGRVSCEIIVDGTRLSGDEADGAHVTASCQGTVP